MVKEFKEFLRKVVAILATIAIALTSVPATAFAGPDGTEVDVCGVKIWDDQNNADGIRPSYINVDLYANGGYVSSATANEATGWAYGFYGLPQYETASDGTEILITYTVSESWVPDGYSVSYQGYNIVNSHVPTPEPEYTAVYGQKVWDDQDNADGIRPDSVNVNLYANGEWIQSTTASVASSWSYGFEGLLKYDDYGNEIYYTVSEDPVSGYTTSYDGYTIINYHEYTPEPEYTSVHGQKIWQDNDNADGIRPDSVTVNLYANDEWIQSTTASVASSWSYSFDGLAKYDDNGNEIIYTVSEDSVYGYTTTYDGYTIVNHHEQQPEYVSFYGHKIWDDADNKDGIRPSSITISLLANGESVATTTASAANDWFYSFESLPKFDDEGKEIEYTVSEEPVAGYTTTYDGWNIINKHTPEENPEYLSFYGHKIWDDADNKDGIRPSSITISLLANGVVTSTTTASAVNDWFYSFENLPKFDNEGKEIEYTVSEEPVAGYTTTYDGWNIINKHVPEEKPEYITISGRKNWDDKDNKDGIRPASVTINLFANGAWQERAVASNPDWTYSFTNLPKLDSEGKEISYTIVEDAIEGYEAVYDGYNVTNKHVPEEKPEYITIQGKKTWDDQDNKDGLRPYIISINLLANGHWVDCINVTEANGWNYSFGEYPKYDDAGKEIEYTLYEDPVEYYETSYDGFNITNVHKPNTETVHIAGQKTWDDADNKDGIRPSMITIRLLANGEIVGTCAVTVGDNWHYDFGDLPKYDKNGYVINYTLREEAVEGYEATYNGFDITNTHKVTTPEYITLSGAKIWNDQDNKDGIRPSAITVRLYANGVEKTSIQVTEATGWKFSFEGLLKYDENGKEIAYTISEDAVEGYTTSIDGMYITNTHIPAVPEQPTNPTPTPTPTTTTTRTYTPSTPSRALPPTGDINVASFGIMAVAGMALMAIGCLTKRQFV